LRQERTWPPFRASLIAELRPGRGDDVMKVFKV
jgi:hypothetical protein